MSENASAIFGQPDDGGPFRGDFRFSPVERVITGPGSVTGLADEMDAAGASRALIITGRTLATKTDLVDRLRSLLGTRCAGVFAESVQHVSRTSVLAATEQARELGIDAVISFGGGSANDTAKAVAMALAHDVRSTDDLHALRMVPRAGGGLVGQVSERKFIPLIAIPTTLSAGEFSAFTGISDPDRQCKDAFGDPQMRARTVILDAELTQATPDWLWGSTGLRAVDHCVETVCSTEHLPFGDALALGALEMLATALPRSVDDPADLVARSACQQAAMMSIFSFGLIPFGMSHGIGLPLGARCDVPHGACSAIVLPEVMDYNRPANAHRQRLIAQSLGVDTGGMSDDAAAAAAAQFLRDFAVRLGIRNRLSDYGVKESDLPGVATSAFDALTNKTNPVPVGDADVIVDLLRRVL